MEEKYLILGKILDDEIEGRKLLSLSSADAVDYLKENYKVDFTAEELEDVAKGMKNAISEEVGDELSDDSLELVAGGSSNAAYNAGKYLGKAAKVLKTVVSVIAKLGW